MFDASSCTISYKLCAEWSCVLFCARNFYARMHVREVSCTSRLLGRISWVLVLGRSGSSPEILVRNFLPTAVVLFCGNPFLEPVHTVAEKCDCTVAEKCDCRRCLDVFCDSRTFLRQCGQGFTKRSTRRCTVFFVQLVYVSSVYF